MVEDHTIPWYFNEVSGLCEQQAPMEHSNGQQQQQQQLQQQLEQQQGQEPTIPEFDFDCSPYMQEELGCFCSNDDVACRDCNTCVCRG